MVDWTLFSRFPETTNRGELGFGGKLMFQAQHNVACPSRGQENVFYLHGQRWCSQELYTSKGKGFENGTSSRILSVDDDDGASDNYPHIPRDYQPIRSESRVGVGQELLEVRLEPSTGLRGGLEGV